MYSSQLSSYSSTVYNSHIKIENQLNMYLYNSLKYIRDYTTQLYVGIILNHYKDPVMNQAGFHGMSLGFEHCSVDPGMFVPQRPGHHLSNEKGTLVV